MNHEREEFLLSFILFLFIDWRRTFMKTIANSRAKGEIQEYKNRPISHNINSLPSNPYKTKKSLNRPLIIVLFLLMAGSFYAGTQLSTDNRLTNSFSGNQGQVILSSRDTVEHYEVLNKKALDLVGYKEINFDYSLSRLNKKEYSSYSEYLAKTSLVRDLFDYDMNYNQDVFNAKHDFTGKDQLLYLEFKNNQRKISADFRAQVENHKENYRKYLNTMRKMNRIVVNN
jgi:hypothetical protein